jgi:hypothetical protein
MLHAIIFVGIQHFVVLPDVIGNRADVLRFNICGRKKRKNAPPHFRTI